MRMKYGSIDEDDEEGRENYVIGSSNNIVQSQSPSGNMLRKGKKKAQK